MRIGIDRDRRLGKRRLGKWGDISNITIFFLVRRLAQNRAPVTDTMKHTAVFYFVRLIHNSHHILSCVSSRCYTAALHTDRPFRSIDNRYKFAHQQQLNHPVYAYA